MSKSRMKLVVIAILLLCATLSMGCLEEKQTHVQEMNEKYAEQTEQYDDEEFLEWLLEYLDEDEANVQAVIRKAEDLDSKELEICGINQQAYSARGLDRIDDFEVSPELRPFVREFKKYMEDSYMQGVYMESGWRDLDFDDIDLSIEYGEKATAHLERAIE